MNNVVMYTHSHVFVGIHLFIALGFLPRKGISEPNGKFKFLRNILTVFQKGCTILHSHQQCIKISLFSQLVFCLLYCSHSSRCIEVSHCDFNYFPND